MRIINTTIISLYLACFDWAKYRKTKGAVKLNLNLDGDNCIPYDAYIINGNVHDVKELQRLTKETSVIYVMDRGYVDYKFLYGIDVAGSCFVTRMKSTCAFKRVHYNPHKEQQAIVSDVLIALTGNATKKAYPKRLWKIKYKDVETKKIYEFLTNDMEREALEVALLYKARGEVEVFFKWIKQHLKIKSFWGMSMNVVYSQIWVALILTILIWINKTIDGIKASPYELMILMRTTLVTKNSLVALCSHTLKPKPPDFPLPTSGKTTIT